MRAGIGASRRAEARAAGAEAAAAALAAMTGDTRAGWALAFAGRDHRPADVLAGVVDVLGGIPIVGGSAAGIIARGAVGYTGTEVAVAAFPKRLAPPPILVESGLDVDELLCGVRLGDRLRVVAPHGSTILVFYDSIRRAETPPCLNVGSRLLVGLTAGLDGLDVRVIGGGTVADLELRSSYVFGGRAAMKQAVVAVVLAPPARCRTIVMHGCVPVSGTYRITRVDGPVVYELDGRPALDVALEFLRAGDPSRDPMQSLGLSLTLGRRLGDGSGGFREADYLNRLILAPLVEERALLLFEADFQEGASVQFMARDNEMMVESVRRSAQELVTLGGLERVSFALYADCAGRMAAFGGGDEEEAQVLLDWLPPNFPILGFYSGVEIAPVGGISRPLDWTGVLGLIELAE